MNIKRRLEKLEAQYPDMEKVPERELLTNAKKWEELWKMFRRPDRVLVFEGPQKVGFNPSGFRTVLRRAGIEAIALFEEIFAEEPDLLLLPISESQLREALKMIDAGLMVLRPGPNGGDWELIPHPQKLGVGQDYYNPNPHQVVCNAVEAAIRAAEAQTDRVIPKEIEHIETFLTEVLNDVEQVKTMSDSYSGGFAPGKEAETW